MKAMVRKLILVGLVLCSGETTIHAADKYDDGGAILHFFANFFLQYEGVVTAVEPEARGGAQVRIRATLERRLTRYPNGDIKDSFDRKSSKECVLRWTGTAQPVPFVPGMRLSFAATSDGQVTFTRYDAMLPYYRKRTDGTIEVLLHVDAGNGGGKVWLRVIPDRLKLMNIVEVGWSRQHGLVVSMFEAGDGGEEGEARGARDKGLPVANVPGERILIGRDGWKKVPDDGSGRNKDVVPPKQRIRAAG